MLSVHVKDELKLQDKSDGPNLSDYEKAFLGVEEKFPSLTTEQCVPYLRFLKHYYSFGDNIRCLDVGCGDMQLWRSCFPWFNSYTGVDVRASCGEHVLFKTPNMRFMHTGFGEHVFNANETFDVILIKDVFQYLQNEDIIRICRVLFGKTAIWHDVVITVAYKPDDPGCNSQIMMGREVRPIEMRAFIPEVYWKHEFIWMAGNGKLKQTIVI